ncbi:MAG TPA: hypothetical protein VFT12_10125 [Thermoanaerobaculia bacterium]|nr:hypothetical protein [Thermoanaerobaculia bacterium]
MRRLFEISAQSMLTVLVATLTALPLVAQDQTVRAEEPAASHGGTVQVEPPRPVAESEDPVNILVESETVDGLVLSVTIDGAAVTLDSAFPARVPKRLTGPRRDAEGDMVTFVGIANGREISRTVVPDNVINASEGEGLVRVTRRQIAAVLATDEPLDSVRVEAPATGASATLDVRSAYARICEADPQNKWCPRRR